jgi:prepilin-type N-terminal cleavage/methylation domain-containing protein
MSRRSGFTLVEVMVVLAVTTMLSALILVYNASSRETLRLFTEKARVAQLILRSKSLALSTYTDSTGTAPCGYGVRLDRAAGTYALVSYRPADCKERGRVDTSEEAFEVVELSEFSLPATIEFGDVGDAPSGSEASYVLFIPPDPAVLIADADGNLADRGLGRVNLRIKGRDTGAIVSINAAGQVTY